SSAKGLSVTVTHNLAALDAQMDDLTIHQLNIDSQSKLQGKRFNQRGELTVERIGAAIPLENISAHFSATDLLQRERASLALRDLKLTMLDGQFKLPALETALSTPRGKGTLSFKDLPLDSVLSLEQQPTLTGSGELAGTLPFTFKGDQFSVNQGLISAQQAGYIRYAANPAVRASAAQNQGLSIALQVLENFHYSALDIAMDYFPNGRLLLANKLSGSNPNWQSGQPIELNVNVEENLLQLLKALQFSSELNESLQRKLEQQQNTP
ncbi:MAG: YdbH domain-containing protein, partial [Pseudomonadales bacterium]